MSENTTTETDAFLSDRNNFDQSGVWFKQAWTKKLADFARTLERQRNAALAKLTAAEKERDEARAVCERLSRKSLYTLMPRCDRHHCEFEFFGYVGFDHTTGQAGEDWRCPVCEIERPTSERDAALAQVAEAKQAIDLESLEYMIATLLESALVDGDIAPENFVAENRKKLNALIGSGLL